MNRDNTIILSLTSLDNISEEFKKLFKEDSLIKIIKDLSSNIYNLTNLYGNAVKIISYSKTVKYPDLTWLSNEDPGFLECSNKTYSEMIFESAKLSYTVGTKNIVYLNFLCPYITKEHIDFAFSKINEKNIIIGSSPNGNIYLLGVHKENYKIFENLNIFNDDFYKEIIERAKKMRLSVIGMEELSLIKNEEDYNGWLFSKNDIKENKETEHHKKRKKKENIVEQENTEKKEEPININQENNI